MAHITSNCLYLDQQDSGQHQNRTYEVIEVDRETRRKDCKICIYSMGLICSLVIIAMIFFNYIKFTDIKNNVFSSLVRYTCYFILFVVTILFIYAIAKVSAADRRSSLNRGCWLVTGGWRRGLESGMSV